MGNYDRVNYKQMLGLKIGSAKSHLYNKYFLNWGVLAIVSLGKIQRLSSICSILGHPHNTFVSTEVSNMFYEKEFGEEQCHLDKDFQ